MANNTKRIRIGLIILGLAGAAGAAYLVGRNITQPGGPNGNGQPIPVDSSSGNQGETVTGDPSELQDGEEEDGLKITLSDGGAQPEDVQPLPVKPGEPLSLEEINEILLRLPPLATDPDDRQAFNLPIEVLPPPRTGETLSEVFPLPPEETPPEVAAGPLEVLRYSPEGEVPLAPFVNVTFNQPMVPLSTLEQLSNEESPVQIEPAVPGIWRWLGTKTLNFQYDSELIDRMPMATEYTVTVPAGTTSQTGGELADTVEFTFRTPPPTLTQSYPYSGDPQPLDPLFFVAFDQRVDPEAVLETMQVEAEGEPLRVQLASDEEIEADDRVSNLVENAVEGRWLVFKASELLPKASTIRVEIGPGTPSAEGPLTTQSSQVYSFQTYAPFEIVDHGCSWYDNCPPLSPLYIQFNNPLNAEAYDERMLRVEPEIPGVTVNIVGNTITLRGATEGRTTYKVTVSAEIEDVFDQTLGRDRQLTFRIGPAEPFLIGPDSVFVTLDPASEKPVLSLYVMNYNRLDVQVYAVQPADWTAFKKYLQEYQRTDQASNPPGRLVRDEVLRIDAPADKLTEVGIDLSDELDGDFGHLIVIAKPPKGLFEEERYWEHVQAWVQVTQIGLDAFVDHSEMLAWATSLADGTPLPELTIEADSGSRVATTGPDGTARFPIPNGGATYLLARQGDDTSLLPASTSFWDESGWTRRSTEDYLTWYVTDDRQMYRPGEEVHLKGWIRRLGRKQDGDVGLIGSLVSNVTYRIFDPQGNEIGTGSAEVNALGGFDFNFSIPENANLGFAYIELDAGTGIDGRRFSHNFQIQEFRRPEFEVTARNETTGPYFVDGSATVAVEASYFAGGPLPNAQVEWLVGSTPTNYNPPNWPDFTFGVWQPWWWYFDGPIDGQTQYQSFSGTTDATGNHYLDMDFAPNNDMRPYNISAEATVFDVNRQAWAGSTNLLVHPADLYVGMRSERYFIERGQPLEIELIVTDLDGNPAAGRQINVTAARLEWKFENGSWKQSETDPQECTVESTDEPVTCEFETSIGGRYRITALVEDEEGRGNKTQITRWVSGGELPPSRDVEQEEATLIPDQENYQPGDVAEILVQSPFLPAEGLLTVSRNGILYTERFEIEEGSYTLQIPIEDRYIPNLNVQVDLVGSAPRADDQGEPLAGVPDRPAYATGSLNLSIPPMSRTLALDVTPAESRLEPGAETTVGIALKDANGEPVPDAELAVIVVDEAILALTNYQLTDPISVFYTNKPSDIWSTYGRASIILADPTTFVDNATPAPLPTPSQALGRGGGEGDVMEEAMAMEAPMAEPAAPMADMQKADDGANTAQPAITVRSDFNPLATFAPDVRTDANGKATVRVKLPDNLTRYRIMVVAVDSGGSKFGSAEANLTARLPLMVRPSAPRFLNFGDSFELPVVLQNQTDEPLSVDVAIESANMRALDNGGLRVEVPANDRIEVRFPSATDRAGTARFQVAAVSGSYTDAASVELPVYTPATTEAFATYGVIDEGAIVQPVAEPTDVFSQFGGLEIQTSSTALQALTDAVIYLVNYPYECSEQIASRVLGVAALRDVLTAFEAEGLPSAADMESAVSRDIELLGTLQNFDGGFPYWRRGQESIPFNTIHVAHALARAEQKGFNVPQSMQDQLLPYLQNIENYYPHWYSLYTRRVLSAYALYVRDLMGDNDPAKARQLYNEAGPDNLSLEAIGWIWQVLVDDPNSEPELESIRRYVANRAVETAGAANFTTTYDDQTYLILSSDRRTDAVLLDAMIADDPDSDLIPKLVNGLLAHRSKGHWRNTQENVFVLLALDRYFNTYEAQTPDFVARIWLGETYAGEHTYAGRGTERHETTVPMSYLVDTEAPDMQDLIIQKEGTGRLYYRLGLKYAPTDLWLDPLDMGFVVQREYEGVDDPEDVYRDAEGVWHIKAGARVRVRLTMVADNRRYHVALVDPLPAGLEIVNPALAVSQSIPQDPTSPEYESGWWWWGTWYEHQNMRDERAEAFTSLLWDGVYNYTYIARATTPGKFVVPPAKAEEMYSPEVFGRSGSDWVVVE